jgi:glycosyltransferase involved in cell wall biosynthesis
LSEGLPVTILEELASGLPIVATRLEGVAEIIKDGQNGFLVDIKNPKQIAEKILFLLSDGNAKKNISFNNIKKSEKYSWDSIVNKLTEVYRLCQTRR